MSTSAFMALHALKMVFTVRGRQSNVVLREIRPSFCRLLANRQSRCRYSQTACKGSNGSRCVDPPDVRKLAKMAHISVTDEEVWLDEWPALILFVTFPSNKMPNKAPIICFHACRLKNGSHSCSRSSAGKSICTCKADLGRLFLESSKQVVCHAGLTSCKQ